jgi:uncharacterized protein
VAIQCFDTGARGPYDARAMGNPLQESHTAAELASVGQVVEIASKISSFDGLAEIVEADLAALDPEKVPVEWRENVIRGELKFGFADAKRRLPMLTGSVTASVDAVCQRCLEPFQLRLGIEPKLLLLGEEELAEGYDEFEVWELDEQMIRLQDIVEELLIMAMPFSAMHDNMADCRAFLSGNMPDEESGEELVRPFAALRTQMTQNEMDPDE